MDLKMEVYSPGLELLGLLEIQRSVVWEEKAFSAGSFSLESLITDESLALLQPENIIWIEGETAGTIEYIQQQAGKDGPYITVKGRTLSGVLDWNILWGLYSLKGTPPEIMHALVDDCCIHPTRGDVEARKIRGLVSLDTPAGGEAIRFQKTGGTLLEALEQLGETYGVAFGVRFNPAIPQMEFWTRWGQNRSIHQTVNEPVLYSTELDDVLSSEYSYNSQSYRNVALVAGEGEGVNRVYVTVNGGGDTPTPPTPPEPPVPEKYTVTLSVDPSGSGTASGGGTVESGTSVTVTAVPLDGFAFAGWQENGTVVSTSAEYTFTATGNRNLTAVFTAVIPTYTVTVSVDPAGGGTATGGGTYEEGAQVTVTATSADGYTFSQWTMNGEAVGTGESYTFTVTGNITITAVFAEKPKVLAYYGTTTGLVKARNRFAAASVGNFALFGGGNSSSYFSTVDAYDASLVRTTPTALSEARNYLAAATIENFALFGGGYNGSSRLATVDAYDASLVRTTPTALSKARNYLAAATIGDFALFGGGLDGSYYLATVDAYDTSLTRTTPTALSKVRINLAAATIGKFALFGGGYNGSSRLATVDAYDTSLTRTIPTALSKARDYLVAATIENFALFGGGYSGSSRLATVDAYDTSLTRTTPTALSEARNSLATATIGDFALFGGGYNGNSYISTVDAYNTSLTRTTPTALSEERGSLAATAVGNFALFAGGYSGITNAVSSVVDVYTLK